LYNVIIRILDTLLILFDITILNDQINNVFIVIRED